MSKVEILMTATNKDGAVTTKNLETESAVVITMTNTGEAIDGDTAVVGGFGDEFGLTDIDKIIAYAKSNEPKTKKRYAKKAAKKQASPQRGKHNSIKRPEHAG